MTFASYDAKQSLPPRTHHQIFSPSHFPTPPTYAYNPPAPTTGVFRETFAGRREPALPPEP
ncbi:Hypothetical protein NGAL_HAMBI2605_25280 [Neorhizobium galegae bv. orientalis]|nr:Hypothetical protein NGAL_HAMBI2605_25280 [Neorhizobium galegae bv. orientalis]